jgi:nuclear pore complex protein Nup205
MSDIGSLESLQSLHGDLLAVCEHRLENVETLRLSLVEHTDAFKKLLDKPSRDSKSRSTVQSGVLILEPPYLERRLRQGIANDNVE